MRLTIETYWNKVVDDASAPFGTRVLPEYELKDSFSWPNSGWESVSEWRKNARSMAKFIKFDDQGRAHFDLSRSYGIHSYQVVYPS